MKNYLCVYLVTALCSVFAEQGGGSVQSSEDEDETRAVLEGSRGVEGGEGEVGTIGAPLS